MSTITLLNFLKFIFYFPLELLTQINLFSHEVNLIIFYSLYIVSAYIAIFHLGKLLLKLFRWLFIWVESTVNFKWLVLFFIGVMLLSYLINIYIKSDEIPELSLDIELDDIPELSLDTKIIILPSIANTVKQYFPNAIDNDLELIASEAKYFNLDLAWVYGIVAQESSFRRHLVSNTNALGLFQIKKTTAQDARKIYTSYPEITKNTLLYNPRVNIEMGMAYIYLLWSDYFGTINDLEKRKLVVTCAYNAGIGTVKRIFNDRSFQSACNVINILSYEKLDETLEKSLLSTGHLETIEYQDSVYNYMEIFN